MAIKIACVCGMKLSVKNDLAGKKVKCPACQELLSISRPAVQKESIDDEWDLADPADEDFDEEQIATPAKSRGMKPSAARGAVPRKGHAKRKGQKSSSQNSGLVIGLSAGGGLMVVALLAWLLWAAPPPNNAVEALADSVVDVLTEFTLKGHFDHVTSVAFCPDGKRLASASADGTVKVWDATSGQETLNLNAHTDEAYCVVFSPDGKRLASASTLEVKVWDATSGQETLNLKGHRGSVRCIAFSPDGKRLASACYDDTVKVWDSTSGEELLTLTDLTVPASSATLAFSPDGKRLALATANSKVMVWDAISGQVMLALPLDEPGDQPLTIAFSSDGKRLAVACLSETVRVWDATSGQEMLTFKLAKPDGSLSMTFSPDGKRLASACLMVVEVFDATNGKKLQTLKGHGAIVDSVAFSPGGKRLATASWDRTVKVQVVRP